MNTLDKKSPDYVVCLCKNITRGQVEAAIREKNLTSLKELKAEGIGDKCGGCGEDLLMILDEVAGSTGS